MYVNVLSTAIDIMVITVCIVIKLLEMYVKFKWCKIIIIIMVYYNLTNLKSFCHHSYHDYNIIKAQRSLTE